MIGTRATTVFLRHGHRLLADLYLARTVRVVDVHLVLTGRERSDRGIVLQRAQLHGAQRVSTADSSWPKNQARKPSSGGFPSRRRTTILLRPPTSSSSSMPSRSTNV